MKIASIFLYFKLSLCCTSIYKFVPLKVSYLLESMVICLDHAMDKKIRYNEFRSAWGAHKPYMERLPLTLKQINYLHHSFNQREEYPNYRKDIIVIGDLLITQLTELRKDLALYCFNQIKACVHERQAWNQTLFHVKRFVISECESAEEAFNVFSRVYDHLQIEPIPPELLRIACLSYQFSEVVQIFWQEAGQRINNTNLDLQELFNVIAYQYIRNVKIIPFDYIAMLKNLINRTGRFWETYVDRFLELQLAYNSCNKKKVEHAWKKMMFTLWSHNLIVTSKYIRDQLAYHEL